MLPTRMIESPQTTRCARPYNSIPILGKTVNTSSLARIIGDSTLIQETEASYRVADPEAARRRYEQGVHVGREEPIAKRRAEAFESRSIKPNQSVGATAQPKETV